MKSGNVEPQFPPSNDMFFLLSKDAEKMLDLLGAPCPHVAGAGEQGAGRVPVDSCALRQFLAKDCEPQTLSGKRKTFGGGHPYNE